MEAQQKNKSNDNEVILVRSSDSDGDEVVEISDSDATSRLSSSCGPIFSIGVIDVSSVISKGFTTTVKVVV